MNNRDGLTYTIMIYSLPYEELLLIITTYHYFCILLL